eukprot:m.217402 g.217402  ORF g.217402 m.217402 type:complete len:352 (+) comp25683_c2_seq2:35-1090(+)
MAGHAHKKPRVETATSGQNDAVFEWDEKLTSAMTPGARAFEEQMHGGFNEDPETGLVYTGIPGYGLVQISHDLTTWTRIGDDERLKGNIHGIVFFVHGGEKYLAVAQNSDERVLILQLNGVVKQELAKPAGTEFAFQEANDYYKQYGEGEKGKIFSCTDVTYHNNTLFVVTGYCAGDFVLTAVEEGGEWKWGTLAWGGKGDAPGQFKTAHGVTAYEGHIYVANREAHQVNKFTPGGDLVEILKGVPEGARICNIAKPEHDDFFIFNPLEVLTKEQDTPDRYPIYCWAADKVISTVIPGDLGIPVLRHCHHVWPHYVRAADGNRQLYLLIHGWNVGKFAVLKHVPNYAHPKM